MNRAQSSLDWRVRVRRARDCLRQAVDSVADLRAVAARRGVIDDLLADLDRQLERTERTAVVALVGATGAGKSSLLNAFVGRPVAPEGVDRPTTRAPVIYAPRDADLKELLVACSNAAVDRATPTVVRYDAGEVGGTPYVLVDSPDLNSVAEEHRAVVRALADHSDILIAVLHRQSVIEEASVSFLDGFARRRGLVFVLNRSDELTEDSKRKLLEQLRELAATRWNAGNAPVLAVSARAAQSQADEPGWVSLQRLLHSYVEQTALRGVRRQNVLGVVSLLQERFLEVGEEVNADLQALPAEATAGLEELVERIARETDGLWQLRRADLDHLLWAEAAKRWDGPGGWALRVGGFGAAGLGAGVLLARRHPLLAAGAALGGGAAQEAQRAAEQRRLSDADGLLPTAGELSAWHQEALSAARIRAARLAGEPATMSLPAAETAYAATSAAVGDAWQTLVNRDLPDAAERSLLRLLRLLLDLPVYALAGWVLFQAGSGFVRGEYVGVDFLVNALLLVVAYLFAVGVLVRRGLGFRSRRLLRVARARSAAALRAWQEANVHAVRETVAESTARLDDLGRLADRWAAELGGEAEAAAGTNGAGREDG
jgi:GTP-binding protein EngB required for normal cell division